MDDYVWSVLQNGFRGLAFNFDSVVYTLINYCYKIILYLSNIDLSNFGGVSTLVSRIYVLLGIFMLFKLAFSIIQYVVAPDSFTDSGKGFGKLATNVMVSMALLVATPWLFSMLYEAQGYILKSNIIGRLVMGSTTATIDNNTKMSVDKISSMANDAEFLLYGAFASLNTDIITNCQVTDSQGNVTEQANIMGTTQQITINHGECLNTLNEEFTGEDLKATHVSLYDFFKYKDGGVIKDDRDIGAFGNLITWQKDSEYVINYIPLISTLVGGYVAFLLIFYCIDVALRAVKLLFLQIVAPISIISYIDPKESISNSKLSNWLKEVFSTWASLFIRLLVIFLVMQLISIIATGVLGNGNMINNESINFGDAGAPGGVTQMFIYVFLVIGCFQFAKKAPELVEKLFGFKMSGDLHLASAGKALGGMALGGAIGTIGAFTGSGALAGVVGAAKGAINGANGKKLGEIAGMSADYNRRLGIARANGSTFLGRAHAAISNKLGTPGTMGRVMNEKRNFDNQIQDLEDEKSSIQSEIAPKIQEIENYNEEKSFIKAMKDEAKNDIKSGKGAQGKHYQRLLRQAAAKEAAGKGADAERIRQKAEEYLNRDGWKERLDWNLLNPQHKDANDNITRIFEQYKNVATMNGNSIQSTANDLNKWSNELDNRINNDKIAIAARQRQIKNIDDQINGVRVASQNTNRQADKARADLDAVQGKEGGPRIGGRGPWHGPGGPGGPRP